MIDLTFNRKINKPIQEVWKFVINDFAKGHLGQPAQQAAEKVSHTKTLTECVKRKPESLWTQLPT